jgi:hypothetical protein
MNDNPRGRIEIFKDVHGFFALKAEDCFTDIVTVKSWSSCAEVSEAINAQIPALVDRITLGRNGQLTPVVLDSIMVTWSLPGGGTGSTILNEGNCGKVLEMLRNRGWKDNLTAMYKYKFT